MRLSERVNDVVIVSGMVDLTHRDVAALPPRPNLQVLRMWAERPRASRAVYRIMATTARLLPGLMVRQASATMPEADRDTIRDPEVARAFLAMLAETFAQGPRGAQVDSALVASAWGFDPADVRVPGAELTVVAGEGHLSLVHRRLGDVLGET